LPYVLLFSILAVLTGGNSFRAIETFITVRRRRLNTAFGLRSKRAPAHTAIRYILQGLDPAAVAQMFRRYATSLRDGIGDSSHRTVAFDGKTLRRSFDNFTDRKAAQVLNAFDVEACLVLAHIEIDQRSNEISAVQRLLNEHQVVLVVPSRSMPFTAEKISRRPHRREQRSSSNRRTISPPCCTWLKPFALPDSLPAAAPRSPPGATGMKLGQLRYSPSPVRSPAPSGRPWSSASFASPAMSCTAIPALACGAAPPRSHTISPILPSRRAVPLV